MNFVLSFELYLHQSCMVPNSIFRTQFSHGIYFELEMQLFSCFLSFIESCVESIAVKFMPFALEILQTVLASSSFQELDSYALN